MSEHAPASMAPISSALAEATTLMRELISREKTRQRGTRELVYTLRPRDADTSPALRNTSDLYRARILADLAAIGERMHQECGVFALHCLYRGLAERYNRHGEFVEDVLFDAWGFVGAATAEPFRDNALLNTFLANGTTRPSVDLFD